MSDDVAGAAFLSQQQHPPVDGGDATGFSAAITLGENHFGGLIPFFLAHASFSLSEWQQQLSQHCVAFLQPHPFDWQGKATERSFSIAIGTGIQVLQNSNEKQVSIKTKGLRRSCLAWKNDIMKTVGRAGGSFRIYVLRSVQRVAR